MKLADYAKATNSYKQNRCRVCELPAELRVQIDENEKLGLPISRSGVARWLVDEGHKICRSSIGRHREQCLGLDLVRM